MRRQLRVSEEFAARMQLLHPMLLSWLGAEAGEEVWHRVHVSHMGGCGCGPGCGDCGDCGGGDHHHGSGGGGRGGEEGHHVIRGRDHDAYVVTQSDITEVVLGERRVCQLQEQQQALLKEILPMEVGSACMCTGHRPSSPACSESLPTKSPHPSPTRNNAQVIEAILRNKAKAAPPREARSTSGADGVSDGPDISRAVSTVPSLHRSFDRRQSPVLEPVVKGGTPVPQKAEPCTRGGFDLELVQQLGRCETSTKFTSCGPSVSSAATIDALLLPRQFSVPLFAGGRGGGRAGVASAAPSSLRQLMAVGAQSHVGRGQTSSLLENIVGGCDGGAAVLHDAAGAGGRSIWLTQQDVMDLATYHEDVTILFSDIVGFTALSQQLHPAQVWYAYGAL